MRGRRRLETGAGARSAAGVKLDSSSVGYSSDGGIQIAGTGTEDIGSSSSHRVGARRAGVGSRVVMLAVRLLRRSAIDQNVRRHHTHCSSAIAASCPDALLFPLVGVDH